MLVSNRPTFREVGKLKLLPLIAPKEQEEWSYADIPARLLTIVDNTKWNLSDKKFTRYQVPDLLPYIYELSCLHLLINYNNRKTLISQLSNIRFTELQEVSLSGNNIESVEELSRVYMPLLRNLLLGYNNIMSIRSFMHLAANCPQIQWLNIEQNPILEYSQIPAYFCEPGLTFNYLEMTRKGLEEKKVARWVAKLPAGFSISTGMIYLV